MVNNTLSLANPPTFSGRNVTITLKHYRWSDGTQVTMQDVMFWLNMELAEPALREVIWGRSGSCRPRRPTPAAL